MINIAIVDDFKEDSQKLGDALKGNEKSFSLSFNFFYFSSGSSFISSYEAKYDIIFLDIELGDENGIEIARKLRQIDKTVILVFVTNVAKYASEGYEVDALDFIVKPVTPEIIRLKMSRIISRLHKSQAGSVLIKTLDDELIKLSIDRIKYLEVDDHYIIYHTTDGDYKEYQTLKQAELNISKKHFVRCNRSYLINLSYIDSIKKDYCVIGDDKLPISRPQKNSFIKAYADFLEGF